MHDINYIYVLGWDSLFSIATHYGLDSLGIESWWGRVFLNPSRLTLGPTQPPVQWLPSLLPGLSSWGKALTTHPHLVPRLKKQ